MLEIIKAFLNPPKNESLHHAQTMQQQQLPTLWLLGKTGAGKSSLIQCLTGINKIEIGSGFSPCTMTLNEYLYPEDKPLLRFLDTRGLGEADYDPAQDIAEASRASNALVVVMRADEPEQSQLLNALGKIKKSTKIKQILVVHTGVKLNGEQPHCAQHNQQQIEHVWGKQVTAVEVDFADQQGEMFNHQQLIDTLSEFLPIIQLICDNHSHKTHEEANFDKLKTEVLSYAGTAAATDLLPVVGLVSVPAIQSKMLHSLANQYGLTWDRRLLTEFVATLGTSFAVQYSTSLGVRQLQKLIPGYGQTVGAAVSSVISFASTYALGRAACYYLYHRQQGENISQQDIQQLYKQAFLVGKKAANHE